MNQLQTVLVDSIRRELDSKLFQVKVNFAKKKEPISEFDSGYLQALEDVEDKIEEVIRYFEHRDILRFF